MDEWMDVWMGGGLRDVAHKGRVVRGGMGVYRRVWKVSTRVVMSWGGGFMGWRPQARRVGSNKAGEYPYSGSILCLRSSPAALVGPYVGLSSLGPSWALQHLCTGKEIANALGMITFVSKGEKGGDSERSGKGVNWRG